MSLDVMKQALEALEYIYTETTEDEDELIHAAIPALRLAIEQAEHELRRLHAENEDHIQQLRKEQLEVERLHRVNVQLLEALDYFMQCVEQSAHLDARIGFMGGAFDKARAAIAAAKGEA